MPTPAKTTFENVNDLLKAILWPLIVFIIFFTYKSELNDIFRLIPKKLERSSKISVGSLSFEIEKTAIKAGNEELADIIKNLSEGGIKKLLTLGSGKHNIMIRNDKNEFNHEKSYSLPPDFDVLLELEKDGLLKADQPLADFLSFYKSLEPIERKRYRSELGYLSDRKDSVYTEKYMELNMPVSKLNASDLQRIDRQSVELSVTGKKAFGIIVKVISEQINN